jgi:death-on-curing protein
VKRLSAEDILLLHNLVIEETGGLHGARDVGALEASCGRPWASFGGNDLYHSLFQKAGALLHSLIKNHPFLDGNKRTGMLAAMTFLERNGYQFRASQKEVEQFATRVARENIEVDTIATWLRRHSRKLR